LQRRHWIDALFLFWLGTMEHHPGESERDKKSQN